MTFKLKNKISGFIKEYRFNFGVHKGKSLNDVPDDYLDQLMAFDWIDNFDRTVYKAYLKAKKEYGKTIPTYINRTQYTRYIMAKWDKDRRDE